MKNICLNGLLYNENRSLLRSSKRNEITFIQTAYSYGAKENNKDIKIIEDAASKKKMSIALPDKRFYKMTVGQPGDKIHQETYCSADGTLCNVTTCVYNKAEEFVKKEISQS